MTMAAGILALCTTTGRFLLMQRSPRQDNPLTWACYGGGEEDGEEPRDTALREFEEETGHAPEFTALVELPTFKKGDFQFHTFLGLLAEEFEPNDCWETFDVGWFPIDNLPTPLHPGQKWLFEHPRAKAYLGKILD